MSEFLYRMGKPHTIKAKVKLPIYIFLFLLVGFFIAVGAYLAYTEKTEKAWAMGALPTILMPLFLIAVKILLTCPRLFITDECLTIKTLFRTHTIAWDEITTLYSLRKIIFKSKNRIYIATKRMRFTIPSFMSLPSEDILNELSERVYIALKKNGCASPEDFQIVTAQPKIHQSTVQSIRDVQSKNMAGHQSFVHYGTFKKFTPNMTAAFHISFIFFSIGFFCLVAGQKTPAIVLAVIGAFFLLMYAIGSINYFNVRAENWIIIHRGGVIMAGKDMNGEIAWDEISEIQHPAYIHLGGNQAVLKLKTPEVDIIIRDIYNVPLCFISETMKTFQMTQTAQLNNCPF